MIKRIHAAKYVHRDLQPHNFLVDGKGQLYFIDLELCYHLKKGKPNPPFTLGTRGYMSPEQLETALPDYAQDIYGLGALMIAFFTGISPVNFDTLLLDDWLKENLAYCIGDKNLAGLIKDCINSKADKRPILRKIRATLEKNREVILRTSGTGKYLADPDDYYVVLAVLSFLDALISPNFAGPDGIWFSRADSGSKQVDNENTETAYYRGLREGVAGILYFIAKAKRVMFDMSEDDEYHFYQLNLDYLLQAGLRQLPPGLFSGTAGIAMSIAEGIRADLITDTQQNRRLIKSYLFRPVDDLNMATGLAGQGLALLQCRDYIEKDQFHEKLKAIVDAIIQKQQPDGSWLLTKKGVQEKGIKLYGFSYGIAGIVYFLLLYAELYSDKETFGFVRKTLKWLKQQARTVNGYPLWRISPKNSYISPWIDDGYTGICLVFIKAYEIEKKGIFDQDKPTRDSYKELAESVLRNHPAHILSNQTNWANGITGLGEVYLEAYRVFQNEEWQQRAGWIAGVLRHTFRIYQGNMTFYWLHGHSPLPAADLLTGNAGIAHFLLRYHMAGKLEFPVFGLALEDPVKP
jgi:serine/threonine protein kinase